MRFSTLLAAGLTALAVAFTREDCGPERRIDIAKEAVAAILKPTAEESTAAYEQLAFSPDAHIVLNPDSIGDVQVSDDRQSSIAFLAVIYQVVTDVIVDKYANINETFSFFNVTGDLGLLHKVPVPANVFFDVFLTYTLEPCNLQEVHVFAQVPSELLDIPLNISVGLDPTPPGPGQPDSAGNARLI